MATNVYGVPWIIGAKKGFPNFNEFEMENIFQLTRKLQLTRPNTTVNYCVQSRRIHHQPATHDFHDEYVWGRVLEFLSR